MDKYGVGVKGEVAAKEYLINLGYRILDCNVNFPRVGELDIVALDGRTLVFVEVRTREDNAFGHPFETFTKSKIAKVVKASRLYLTENEVKCENYRYDAIAVFRGNVEHIKDAFYAKW